MSRSGYTDDYEETWPIYLFRANVDRSLRGKRGQAFLREMADALDAMPVRELVAHEIVTDDGKACAIGSVALARGLDVSEIDETDPFAVADTFGIAEIMAREIAYENDENGRMYVDGKFRPETPAERWTRMRKWVDDNLRKP